MKCDEFEAHLDEILDERRRPEWDALLREHSACCPRCRDLASAYGVLFEGFRSLKLPEPPANLSARVLDGYLARPRLAVPAKAALPAAAAAAVLSTAAAVLVAVFLTRDGQREQVAIGPPGAQANVTHPKQLEQIKFDLDKWKNVPLVGAVFVSAADGDDQTDPYEALAKGTGRSLANVVLRMPGVAGPRGIRPLEPPFGAEGAGVVWPVQMSDELRPVTESVGETFDLILDALPVTFWARHRTRDS
jgi:hypothetical protein